MTGHRDLLQEDIDKRFSVEQAAYTVAVQKARFRIEAPSDADYMRNMLRMSLETWFLKEELYQRDATLRIERKIRPRWIPERIWNRIPTEVVSQTHHFTVDRIYPNANPDLGTPTTIKERLDAGPWRTEPERSTWK